MLDVLVEPYGGFAAVGLSLLTGDGKLASRRGNKAGYAEAILRSVGSAPGAGARAVVISDIDPKMESFWRAVEQHGAEPVATALLRLGADGRETWARCREAETGCAATRAAMVLYDIANAYGGDGGFKPPPRTRACAVNVCAATLARRVARLAGQPIHFARGGARALREVFPYVPNTVVVLDGPYAGTTPYTEQDATLDDVVIEATAWAAAGASVVVCEGRPLHLHGWRHVDISGLRRGQSRGNFTKSSEEHLTVWDAR